MKRPFAVSGAVSLAMSFAALYGGSLAVAAVFAVACIGLFLSCRFGGESTAKHRVVFLCLTAVFLHGLLTLGLSVRPQSQLAGSTKELNLIVTEEPEQYDGFAYCHVKVADGSYRGMNLQIYAKEKTRLQAGNHIQAVVRLHDLPESYRDARFSEKTYVSATLYELKSAESPSFSFYAAAAAFRSWIKETILANTGENGPALTAIATGDRQYLDEATEEAIRRSGVSHLMAVSGLHLGIVCGALLRFLRKTRLNDRLTAGIVLLTMLAVVVVCGFHVSALRASIAYIVMLTAPLLRREADRLNSLGFAVTVLVLWNPFMVGSVAFLLSASATFGVAVAAPLFEAALGPVKAKGWFGRVFQTVRRVLIVSVSAILCTLPVSVWVFGSVSIFAVLVNLLVTYPVSLALICTVTALLLVPVPVVRFAAGVLFFTADLLAAYFMAVIRFFGSFDFAVLRFGRGMAVFFVLLEAGLLFWAYTFKKHKLEKKKEERQNGAQ